MAALSKFRRCLVSGHSPYPCSPVTTPVPMTSLSHTQRLLDLSDLFIYSAVRGDGK